ncbi:MAG TPA: site-2 protease family protein [Pilimelia sp.]|nr:site-2 protease family protein [Pilimelia sp.]
MRQTVRLARVTGIPVGVHWSVLVVMVLLAQGLAVALLPAAAPGLSGALYWVVAVLTTVLFVASLLAHELAHALVARHYGVRVERVTLWLLGGVAELSGQPATPRQDLRIAAVGPLTSLAAAGVFFTAAVATAGWLPPVAVVAVAWLAWINVVLAVFNLLPAAPLDGGRVLRALLWRHWGDQVRAQLVAVRAGRGLGGGLIALGFLQILLTGTLSGLWLALLGWFLVAAAGAEQQAARLSARLGGLTVRSAMDRLPAVGRIDHSVQDFLEAIATARQRVFPVVDPLGRPAGIVTLATLARVAPAARSRTPLGAVMLPVTETVEADRPLADVAALATGSTAVLVADHGILVGTLTAADIARAVDLATLGAPTGPRR